MKLTMCGVLLALSMCAVAQTNPGETGATSKPTQMTMAANVSADRAPKQTNSSVQTNDANDSSDSSNQTIRGDSHAGSAHPAAAPILGGRGINLAWLGRMESYAETSIGVKQGLGYQNPDFTFAMGEEYRGARWLGLGETTMSLANKYIGSGISVDGHLATYRRFGLSDGSLLAGGGIDGGKIWTAEWTKGSLHPFVGGGFDFAPDLRLLAGYRFVGTDKSNGVRAIDLSTRFLIHQFKTRRLAVFLTPTMSVVSFYPTGQPNLPRRTGLIVHVGLRIQRSGSVGSSLAQSNGTQGDPATGNVSGPRRPLTDDASVRAKMPMK
jgi:hypothetical protein